jgi:hypothetical protein
VAGIYKLKLQNAVIELQKRVVVQSIDENNIIVKVRIKIKNLIVGQFRFTIQCVHLMRVN